MTTPAEARASVDQAQSTYEQCVADVAKINELLPWLTQATTRARGLFDFYSEESDKNVAAILAEDPAAVTPTVANEDAVWEVLADLDDAMMRLLRFATAEVTSRLDDPTRC